MKVPLSWLRDFIDLPTDDPHEIEEVLASLGHEVERIEHVVPTFEGVVVGKVESVGPHPNADKIRFCRVNDGAETRDVVCGAWNFETGAIIAYAGVGSRLNIHSEAPFEIGARELRGVMSNGMIASARELGLGDDHEGILVLDELGAATDADLGRPFDEVIGLRDTVLDVSITPNRGDCMSVRGLARDLAAYWDIPLKDVDPEFATGDLEPEFSVELADTDACPRFVGYEIDGVTLGPAPLWMQLRLLSVGQRPISNVVDVSNYVMLELGHPIHTFDADTLADKSITIRRAEAGETLTTLDGSRRKLVPQDILVTDPSGPVALAGVMGGATTEVSDRTENILVEAAHWDPPSILFTSHRLGLRSEASARFERGVDPNLSDRAAARAIQLIQATANGTPRLRNVDAYPDPIEPWAVELTSDDVGRLLGPDPTFTMGLSYLERLGFGVEVSGDTAVVTVPTHRRDVTRAADLVEEIARLYGYERFPDRIRRGKSGNLSPVQSATRRLRATLVGAGMSEAQTLSFIGQSDLDALHLPDWDSRRVGLRVKNPLRDEEGTMRTTLLPGLIAAATRNVGRGTKTVRLFETGRVFLREPDPEDMRIPHQPENLGFIMVGSSEDVFSGADVVRLIADSTGRTIDMVQEQLPALHPGRGARLDMAGDGFGFVGELHPAVVRETGLSGRVVVGEMALGPLVSPRAPWRLSDVSVYPPHVFDLAFILGGDVTAAALLSCMAEAASEHLEELELFDEYRGDELPAATRSLAVRVVLRAMDQTLSDDEVAPIRKEIVEAVATRLGGQLRGSL